MFKRFLLRFAMLFLTLEIARAENLSHLMLQCAPSVHPITLGALIRTESGGYPYALSDDGPQHLPWQARKNLLRSFYPKTLKEATDIAKMLIHNGHFVGIGLTQVNSQHLSRLGLTVEQLLDPCTNLRAGVWILTHFYIKALRQYKNPQSALLAAISAFNTGDFKSGFANGYVQKVMINAGITVPLLNITKPRRRLTTPASPAPSGHVNPRRQFLQAKFSKLEFE
ncbi:Putative Lytic transglycosylase-like, catalytic precursor [Candidatus Glomeribacter gigasporarum BEG34]|uniref:Putative Lytic transglycosylase-like, catalytic n=2 Tax=Candidatus Glomeribacter gigasporarum TaxID=132144 RepID=G2J9A4_9BURK|nr:Putative Lytic transglycosylase-like, catalytic precursor [Candidatus Glomeribacter gigasporarum BEG34]